MFIYAVEGFYIFLQCVLVQSGYILDYFDYLILDVWPELPRESIINSFQPCALDLALDGLEDDKIVCLRKGQLCEKGLEMLETDASILSEVPVDTFTPEDSDVEEAVMPYIERVDSDDESDDDIDVMG